MRQAGGAPRLGAALLCAAALLGALGLCVCVGSVNLPLKGTLAVLWNALAGRPGAEGLPGAVLLQVRLPRVLCVALVGAALSLCGAAMQGLLRNPLADGSTLGVSSGASLGAVLAIALGLQFPALPFAGTLVLAVAFAFLSLVAVLGLAARLDGSFSTQTIVLLGVVYSMFASSLLNLTITFFPEKVRSITFWTMGSLAGSSYANALLLFVALAVFGGLLLLRAGELNAFALGEDNARNIGVDVRRCKLTILACVSALTGVCVAVGGSIGFVGLVTPHMARMLAGPNHKRLLPFSAVFGAVFLLLADLAARVVLRPMELPIGVITSLVGAAAFIYIFCAVRRGRP